MRWLLRFAVLATLLAPLCWLALHPYERALAVAVSHALGLFGVRLNLGSVNVAAPFDLGLFVALCLAARRAPWRVRLRALAVGIPILMLIEIFGVACSIAIMLRFRGQPDAAETAQRAGFYLSDTIPWVSAGLVWLALMGSWELPASVGGARNLRASRPRRPDRAGHRAP
jgi:hypothetical protein